ncbi:hypothetical protein QFZ81_003936 [Paenibacillus sp. V4I9]|uniref:stalk domain-containing protein n=1 Tax=Paenibacillus sp. V4I9 TaxID=3042308 RepID=UPI00277D9BC5|nr:stalk domain-containing protein [Paenibacillus sp. V4I9]MDQ0888848.1 hypothetical protein [Paenibacillus sp. V4I9]
MNKSAIVIFICAAAFVTLLTTNWRLHAATVIEPGLIENQEIQSAVKQELRIPVNSVLTEQNLAAVKKLRLEGKQIRTIAGVEKLPNLESLSLQYTSVQDLTPIANLNGLKNLFITNSDIRDISPLSQLDNLQWLDLSGNEIESIESLSKLRDLRSVTLDNNRIFDFKPLLNSPKLYIVSLKMNPVVDLTFLKQIPILQAVYLNGVQVINYEVLKDIRSLHYVMISPEQYDTELLLWQELAGNQVDVAVMHSSNTRLEIDHKWVPAEGSYAPFVRNGIVLVPVRIVSEQLKSKVDWDGINREVSITQGSRIIRMSINQTQAEIDGSPFELEASPVIVDNVTFVPVRFIAEALGLQVNWNEAKHTVILLSQS